jgi:hypothetical protein
MSRHWPRRAPLAAFAIALIAVPATPAATASRGSDQLSKINHIGVIYTTSILSTIEERYGLASLSSREAAVNSLSNVFAAKQYEASGQ